VALIYRLAVEAEWADIGGGFNLNVRIDTVPPTVLRVHRPWPTRRRVAGLRRLRERLVGAGVHVARPIAMLGHDVVRVNEGRISRTKVNCAASECAAKWIASSTSFHTSHPLPSTQSIATTTSVAWR
jgi:hypothetical protein